MGVAPELLGDLGRIAWGIFFTCQHSEPLFLWARTQASGANPNIERGWGVGRDGARTQVPSVAEGLV